MAQLLVCLGGPGGRELGPVGGFHSQSSTLGDSLWLARPHVLKVLEPQNCWGPSLKHKCRVGGGISHSSLNRNMWNWRASCAQLCSWHLHGWMSAHLFPNCSVQCGLQGFLSAPGGHWGIQRWIRRNRPLGPRQGGKVPWRACQSENDFRELIPQDQRHSWNMEIANAKKKVSTIQMPKCWNVTLFSIFIHLQCFLLKGLVFLEAWMSGKFGDFFSSFTQIWNDYLGIEP